MATPHSAAWAYGQLKDRLTVREHGSWRTHNRGARGDGWGPVHGVLMHHYGPYSSTSGAIRYAIRGSTALPGPLYNILVDRAGTVHMIGWGRANHAGKGDDDVLRALIAERYPLPIPNERNVDGNARLYGVCLLNRGDGQQSYPAVQLDAAAMVAAVLCHGHRGWTERSVIGHREWSPGKVDPSYTMTGLRARVARQLAALR